MTSFRNFALPPVGPVVSFFVKSIPCRSFASGCVDVPSSSSVSISSPRPKSSSSSSACLSSVGFAQSGVGCSCRYCLRSRRMYSFPLIISSDSATRNFLNLLLPASETVMRSSSLSCHTAGRPSNSSSSFSGPTGIAGCSSSEDTGPAPESRKKSYSATISKSKHSNGVCNTHISVSNIFQIFLFLISLGFICAFIGDRCER